MTIKRASLLAIHLARSCGWNHFSLSKTIDKAKQWEWQARAVMLAPSGDLSCVAGTLMWRWAELATDRLNLGSHRSTVSRSFTLHTTTKSVYTSRLIIFPLYNYFTPAESFRQNWPFEVLCIDHRLQSCQFKSLSPEIHQNNIYKFISYFTKFMLNLHCETNRFLLFSQIALLAYICTVYFLW